MDSAITKYTFLSADEFISDIKISLPEVFANNRFISELGIRNALAIYLKDKFSFNSTIISKLGNNLSPKETLLNFAKNHERFTLLEIDTLAKSLGTVLNYHLASLYEYSLRISDDIFIAKKSIYLDSSSIDDALDQLFAEKYSYMPLREINNFSVFPEIKFQWNQRLLESYLMTFSSRYRLLYAESLSKNNTCGAVIKKIKCQYWTFNDVVADALAESDTMLQEEYALNFLAKEGYIVKRRYSEIEEVIAKARNIRERIKE